MRSLFACNSIKWFGVFVFVIFAGDSVAQQKISRNDSTDGLFTSESLQEDFLIFRRTLETTYPSLYRYSDSVTMSAYLDKQFTLLNKPMNEVDFYKIIALSCARVNDEHLIPSPSNSDYMNRYFENTKFFPFTFRIINRRFYVIKCALSPSPIKPGSELIAINGRSVEDILNLLLPTIPSDGYIQTFNIRHLEDYSLTQVSNLFDLNYSLFADTEDSFRLEYVSPGEPANKQTLVVPGLTRDQYRKFYNERRKLDQPLTFKYLEKDVAYLKISSFLGWHRRRFRQNFDSLYQVIFAELRAKRTSHLILDLRNNEGGDNTGEKLLLYLLPKPYRHFDYLEKKYVGIPSVSAYLENANNLIVADTLVYKTATGYRPRKEYYDRWTPLLYEQRPMDMHFNGQLTVLMNGASGSMASVVCSFLKSNSQAVFIGEESGGAMEGPTSRSFAKLTLPNTHITIDVPLTKTVNAVSYTKGRGVIPDYWIEPAIDDLLHTIDTELNFALKLIGRK